MLRPFTVPNLLRLPLCHWRLPLLLLVAVVMASCTGPSAKIEGIPSNLPDIPLYGSASTPPHSMSKGDYPFDSNGNYVTAWAAQGGGSSSGYTSGHSEETPPEPTRSKSRGSSLSKVEKAPPEIKSSYSPKSSRKTDDEPAQKPKKKVASDDSGSSSKKKPSTSSGSSSTPKKKTSSGGGTTKHVVKPTDTLAGIAKKYGTTEAKLKKANGLKSDLIRDGAALIIPK